MGKEEITIRPLERGDIDAILEIERASFPAPWSRQMFLDELDNASFSFFIVAEEQGDIIGYGGFRMVIDEAHIGNLAVRADRRRRGIGKLILDSMLLTAREERISSIMLEVRVTNEPAQQLYRSSGFRKVGLRRGYYPLTGEDAVLMTASLDRS